MGGGIAIRCLGWTLLVSLIPIESAYGWICFKVPPDTKNVRVSVVAIIASKKPGKIDPRLKCIARHIQKLQPELKSFRTARMSCKTLPVQGTDTFELIIDQKVKITILKNAVAKKKVQLKVEPPTLGAITYTTCCGKFFPIITRYKPKPHERLILAVCVNPCRKKK